MQCFILQARLSKPGNKVQFALLQLSSKHQIPVYCSRACCSIKGQQATLPQTPKPQLILKKNKWRSTASYVAYSRRHCINNNFSGY